MKGKKGPGLHRAPKKLTESILKPKFTGSQAYEGSERKKNEVIFKGSSAEERKKATRFAKFKKVVKSTRDQAEAQQVVVTATSEYDMSLRGNAKMCSTNSPNLSPATPQIRQNRFSGTSQSDYFSSYSSTMTQTPTQSWNKSTNIAMISQQSCLSPPKKNSRRSILLKEEKVTPFLEYEAKTDTIKNTCDEEDVEEISFFSKKRRTSRRIILQDQDTSKEVNQPNHTILQNNSPLMESHQHFVQHITSALPTTTPAPPQINHCIANTCCEITQLGIPEVVTRRWQQRGITRFHSWQWDCLNVNSGSVLRNGENLVYSAPTGGGKTLVAEILMVKRILNQQQEGLILWVVPLKALANEIAAKLRLLLENVAIVDVFHSDNSKSRVSSKVKVAVCTIERANMIINQQIELQSQGFWNNNSFRNNQQKTDVEFSNSLFGISMIVVDEIHNVEKNPILERLLTKINFINSNASSSDITDCNCDSEFPSSSSSYSPSSSIPKYWIQIVACSATIPNVESIAKWCHASMYITSNRTTILDWFLVTKRQEPLSMIHKATTFDVVNVANPCTNEMSVATTPHFSLKSSSSDTHGLIALCADAMKKDLSVLVFCNSRLATSKLATFVASALRKVSVSSGSVPSGTIPPSSSLSSSSSSSSLSTEIQSQRHALSDELFHISGKQAANGLGPLLRVGIGFHHAALSQEEKVLVETGFKSRTIDILFATTTLANGVNLPADRVVIYDPVKFTRRDGGANGSGRGELYSVQELKQMGGRAAREGEGGKGSGDVIILTTTSSNGGGILTDQQKLNGKKGYSISDILGQPQPPIMSSILEKRHDLKFQPSGGGSGGNELTGGSGFVNDVLECCVLEAVCLGLATTKSTLISYVHSLFVAYCFNDSNNNDDKTLNEGDEAKVIPDLVNALTRALSKLEGGPLKQQPLLTLVEDRYIPEALGRATISAFLTPLEARTLLSDIIRASEGMAVQSQLHLLCLVAPLESGGIPTPWTVLFEQLVIGNHEDWCLVADVFICPMWRGRLQQNVKGTKATTHFDAQVDSKLGRFYRALLLKHIIEEEPLSEGLPSLSHLEIGKAQALQRSSFDLCGKVLAFCRTLGFSSIATMLKPLRNRLQFGVKKELLPLRALLSEATPSLLRTFFDAGFITPKSFLGKEKKPLLLEILSNRRQVHYVDNNMVIDDSKIGALRAQKDDDLVMRIVKTSKLDVMKTKILNKRK